MLVVWTQMPPSGSPLHHLFLRTQTTSVWLPSDRRMRLFWGDTRAQRAGGHPSLSLLWSLHWGEPGVALRHWDRGHERTLHMPLQQKEPIDEATDWLWVYLMVIPLFPRLHPPSLSLLFSLFLSFWDSPCISIFLIKLPLCSGFKWVLGAIVG